MKIFILKQNIENRLETNDRENFYKSIIQKVQFKGFHF
jgi:hypothetical protein